MSDINRWVGSGRLGQTPEIRYLQDGTPSVNFNLASSRYAGKDGDGKSCYETTWIPCQWIDKRIEVLMERLVKGRWLAVDGRLETYQTERMKAENQPPRMVVVVEDVTFPPEPKQT